MTVAGQSEISKPSYLSSLGLYTMWKNQEISIDKVYGAGNAILLIVSSKIVDLLYGPLYRRLRMLSRNTLKLSATGSFHILRICKTLLDGKGVGKGVLELSKI
mmetsp:Transcript_40156/g.45901  ORF Transcript_40156/g.45901 Transcript_40156/m.45901 type:complete len:103 (-) Transcript_40156:1765-2073(-)